MGSLIDSIVTEGVSVSSKVDPNDVDVIMRRFGDAHRFDIDNVAAYFATQRDWLDWRLDDFPSPVPPFETLWMEFRQPAAIGGRSPIDRVGVLIGTIAAQALEAGADALKPFRALGFDMERLRWIVVAVVFMRARRSAPSRLCAKIQYALDDDGSVMRGNDSKPMLYVNLMPHDDDRAESGQNSTAAAIGRLALYPAMLAMSFSHCKNVRVVDGEEMPPKLAQKFEKRHGRQPFAFKVLEIDPMREVLRREGGSEAVGLKRALHICRGHFANYSAERPMFGRLSGRFWVPAHVRGAASEGVVEKSYRVKAGVVR